MGIFSIGQLARTPLELLEDKFGVMGNQLFHHAHGIIWRIGYYGRGLI